MFEVIANAGFSPQDVGAVIATLLGGLIAGGFVGKKVSDSNKTTIDPQPLLVKMQEEFVSRREFDKLEVTVALNATKAEGYFREASNEMRQAVSSMAKSLERQNERLTSEISKVAGAAYEGRQRIHAKVNDLGEQIAALRSQINVAGELAEVGEAIVETMKSCQGGKTTR
jgi:hypothetical protein